MSKTRLLEAVAELNLGEARRILAEKPALLWVSDRRDQNLMVIAGFANCQELKVPPSNAVRVVDFLLAQAGAAQSRFPKANANTV